MKITKRQIRRVIKEIMLSEQVIGYKPPSKKDDDDNGGYETVGTMGVDVDMDDDSSDTQQATSQNIKSLTAQRQQALDKDDIEGAEEAGQQLSKASSLEEGQISASDASTQKIDDLVCMFTFNRLVK
jgi:hypothetical protein|tara:strand:- start:349 stop:729 length:381 start_codon:yes stop_codon:yes gene_type:complete